MESYGRLEQIVDETIARTIETDDFGLGDFIYLMEDEFTRLGFREQSARGGIEKILLLRLDAVGDFILLSPSIRAVRENFPNAYITLAVTKVVYPMAELCPYVNEVIAFNTPYKYTHSNDDILQIIESALDLSSKYFWRRRFDVAFSFLNDATHCFMAYMSGARIRIAKRDEWAKFLMTDTVPLDHTKIEHWCTRNLELLGACGLKINSDKLELWCGNEDFHRAKDILDGFAPNRVKIAVGLGANSPERHYPVEKYLVAFKEIIDKGAALVILGGSSERDDAKFLEDNLPKEFVKNIVALNPTWRVTSAVIALTDMYIGNDTGTHHVAAAFKKPVIVLSRDSKDLANAINYCEHIVFMTWQTKSITLMPEHPIGDCAKEFTCLVGKPHCITQIEPAEIVAAYDEMVNMAKLTKV